MARHSASKERILDTSADLFRRQGYAGTALKQIVAEGSAPIGSLYHYFPDGKEQLGAQALTRSGQRYRVLIASVFERCDTVSDGARAWFRMAADLLERSDYADGCPIATVALEVASTSEPLREVCAEVFSSWLAMITERLVDEGVSHARATTLAAFALSALEGAFVLSRTTRDTESMIRTGEIVASVLAT